MTRLLLMSLICCGLNLPFAYAEEKETEFVQIDLSGKFTQSMKKKFAEYDKLSLPPDKYFFGDVEFQIGKGIIQLGSLYKKDSPDMVVNIEVNQKFGKLHLLHGTAFGGGANVAGTAGYVQDGTRVGEYIIRYADNTKVVIPIVYGEDVRDWWFLEGEKPPSRSRVVFESDNKAAARVNCRVRFYMTTWKNPHPDKKVITIDFIGRKTETAAAPFCMAMSHEK
ncbi:MAG: hypothetical protein KDA77_07345 [Planctomycetaceae bacterium]|nr:hypothetical protein [Planctomycetaceae bacterium]